MHSSFDYKKINGTCGGSVRIQIKRMKQRLMFIKFYVYFIERVVIFFARDIINTDLILF